MMNIDQRVLVIGLDGATWDVLGPWMTDGTLPNLARLRRQGRWGVLHSTVPPITAPAWSTFMTGKKPGKHGVFHFLKIFENNAAEGSNQLVGAQTLQSPALWDVLGHYDRLVGLINIPLTYPPRPVNGFMITGLLTPKHARVFTHPPELSESIGDYQIDLERFAGKTPYQDVFDRTITNPSLEFLNEFFGMLEKRARVTLDLIGSRPWDFFMVVFTGPDRLGHYFWKYHSPVNRETDYPELTEGVRRYYMRLDQVIGELVGRAGRDTAVMCMSDHGMGPVPQKQIHIGNWLQQHGWLEARFERSGLVSLDRVLARLGVGRDQLRKILARVPGLMKTRSVQKVIRRRASVVDNGASRAYTTPVFFNIAGIRLNLPETAKGQALRELDQGLKSIRDPETGTTVITDVISGRDYYAGPCSANVPDVIVIADPKYCFKHELGAYSSTITERQSASGPAKHRMEGIFMVVGEGIPPRSEPVDIVHLEDIAPTVLHLMGLPVPSDMDGRVLTDVFAPEYLQLRPVKTEAPKGYWPAGKPQFHDKDMSAEDEVLIQNQLRSLGYLD